MNSGSDRLGRLIAITEAFQGKASDGEGLGTKCTASTAICQDAMIFGVDVEDYVAELEEEFGAIVWDIPWLHYTDQTSSFRGCSAGLFPFYLLARLARWPFFGGDIIPKADPGNFPKRLELGHIAKVIDAGHWIEPSK